MKIYNIFKQSFKSILGNKVRSFLTVLGIIIGIGSVIGLLSLGNGVQENISKQIGNLGSTNITVLSVEGLGSGGNALDSRTQNRSAGYTNIQTLTKNDFEALKSIDSASIQKVTGAISGTSIFNINGKDQRKNVTGVTPGYFEITSLNVTQGRSFNEGDNTKESYVAVLGSKLASDLFGNENAINKTIQIQNKEFTIVGVLENKEGGAFNFFNNPNSNVFIPDEVALDLFDTNYYSVFTIKSSSEDRIEEAKTIIENTLLKSHNITDKSLEDFSVTTSKDLLNTISQVTGVLTSLLAGIAGISLLVGGIGIMNIMLVSVTERTREIGLRKAVGAQTSDIMIQFVIEAVILTLIGGLFGVLLGYGISLGASKVLSFQAIVTTDAILLAFGVSSIIGIIFGIYPAAKAARLNPIDALRYE